MAEADRGRAEQPPVLLVEDDDAVASSIERALAREGLRIERAATAGRARSSLDAGAPSLILLDLGLPDADGRALLSEIRSRPETAVTPVLVLTGRRSEMVRRECLALGADGFVEKPFDLEELLAEVAKALDAPRREAARDRPPAWLPSEQDLPSDLVDRYERWRRFVEEGLDVSIVVLSLEAAGEDPRRRPIPDEAAAPVVEAVERAVRSADEVWRLEGLRAALLLPETDVGGARRAVDRLRHRLEESPPDELTSVGLHAVVEAGVAELRPDERLRPALERARRSQHLSPPVARPREVQKREGPARVLLVEDDRVTARLIQDRLEREGYDVSLSTDGKDAIQRMEESAPDLTILDLELPGVGGFQVLRRVNESGTLRDRPVIVLTALGEEDDATRAFEMGASDYMVKPLSPAELLARVDRLLNSRD